MPEATGFQVSEWPRLREAKDSMRVLVVAGNMTKYVGDLDMPLWLWLVEGEGSRHWDHVVYVPGPYDYAGAPVDAGDEYASLLAQLDDRLTVLTPHAKEGFRSVVFDGPGVRVVGAPCWPVSEQMHRAVGVYERDGSQTAMDAVVACRLLTAETAQRRLETDGRVLLEELKRAADDECRVVVSFGCPADALAGDGTEEARLPGGKATYDLLDAQVTHWFYGDRGSEPTQRLVERALCHCNYYMSGRTHFSDRDRVIELRRAAE